jgi:ketosteroid isomerase-like protein
VKRDVAVSLLERLHAAQGSFYAGGPAEPLRALLATGVVWHVPGHNAIAGTYRGIDAVMDYFSRRRELAQRSFRMHPGELLVGDGEHVAVLTDGSAVIDGTERRWSTVGLYRFRAECLLSCYLLPLDPVAFDEIWS